MAKKTKIRLISAAALIFIGLIIFVGVMTMLKWDFKKLSTVKYETNEYAVNEIFTNISVKTQASKVTFATSDTDTVKVICNEQKNLRHEVFVNDGTLTVKIKDTRKWYEYIGIGFGFGSTGITVYLPSGSYGASSIKTSTGDIEIPKDFSFESLDISGSTADVNCRASVKGIIKIKVSTGDIKIENLSAGALDLTVSTGQITANGISCTGELKSKCSTGKISFTDLSCESLVSEGDTGDIYLKNVIATEKFDIKRDTGDVKFDGCDAGEIFVTTDTGDVKGTLLSEKVFIPRSKTGQVTVPKTVNGGRCEITTDTGNIIISLF